MARNRTRYLALLTTLSLLTPGVALAGPDDGKAIATQSHVDSPKTFWEGDNFVLKSEHNSTTTPLPDTVAWIGKGWGRDGGNQYQFTLPADNSFDFIGKPGETYYAAPFNPTGSHDPIWLGFGADAGLPVKNFRDEYASLDIVSVDGPGDFELFNYHNSPADLRRMLGTTPNSAHSAELTAGTHTHNYTMFTKPGRYEVTYRTTARKKDGTLIASEPTTTSLQVGGMKPADSPTPSLQERYDAAADGDASAAGYKLSIAPKSNPEKDGDKNLSTISFNAENKASGTLTLLIDGYFLTDLPVSDGVAQWDEFLGPLGSEIQAVFTPEGDAPRWISETLAYAPQSQVSTDSAKSADKWNESHKPRNLAPMEETVPSTPEFHTRIERVNDSVSKLVVDTEDKNFSGFINGGLYERGSNFATLDFDAAINNGHAEFLFEDEGYYDEAKVKVTVTPHPTIMAGSGSVVLTDKYESGKTYKADGKLDVAEAPSDENPTNPTTSSVPKETSVPATEGKNPEGTEGTVCSAKLSLDHGHVDIMGVREGDAFETKLKDETNIGASGLTYRKLDDVVFAVHNNAMIPRPENHSDPSFDFMGPVGEKTFLLPQTQKRDVIWPGYNTETLNYKDYKDGVVQLNIKPVSMPEGASFGMWLTDFGGPGEILVDSTKDDFTIDTTFPTHTHTNWAFSKPGTYVFEVTYTAETTDGKKLASQPQHLTMAMGDKAIADCAADKPEPKPAPSSTSKAPAPKPAPSSTSAAPKPKPTTKPAPSSTSKAPAPKPAPSSTSAAPKPKPTPKPQPKPQPDKEGSSFNPLSLVLPVVLATIFQAFFNFYRDHRAEIDRWMRGLTGR
ncbi:choice-of-anchor M domain-containing protein [Corynebacterium striatum]|uniref:choice-of-anchor M domain-containing protein n=1 Tax=Corynebacterium striatum TaxID=43770 RepID=UPI003D7AC873